MGAVNATLRAWIFAAFLAMVAGMLAWPWTAPALASRALDLSFTARGTGPLELRWTRNTGAVNGIWIDLADHVYVRSQDTDGTLRCTVVQHLPSYDIARLELRSPPHTTIAVQETRILPTILGIRHPSTVHKPEPGATSIDIAALPPVWRQMLPAGLAIGAAFGASLVGFAATVAWLVRRYDRFRDQRQPRTLPSHGAPRRLTLATVLICIVAPLQMALWSPVFILADSTAYVWFAHDLLESRTLNHFDGWRLPGYALLLASVLTFAHDFAWAAGLLQGIFAAITSLLVLDMLRSRLRGWWPHATAVVVAIDPILLGWTRVLMPESLAALLITLAAWLFLRLTERPHPASTLRAVMGGLLLGLMCGAACWVRGNNQVVPAVLIAGLVSCGVARRHWPLLAAAALTSAATLAVMLPVFFLNARLHDRFAFTIGRNFTRSLFSWENGTTDWNQSGTLSFHEFRTLRDRLRAGPMTDWDVMAWLTNTTTVPVPEGASPWLAQEVRCAALVNEAAARRGPLFTARQFQAATILLGVPIARPSYGVRGTWAIFAQLRGEPNERTTTNFDFRLSAFPPEVQETLKRSIHDVGPLQGHPAARVFGAWFDLWRWLRAVLGAAFLLALARLILHRQWAFAALGLVVLANIIGVPVLTYAAEYRYAAPYYPLMFVVVALGLALPGRRSPPGRNL